MSRWGELQDNKAQETILFRFIFTSFKDKTKTTYWDKMPLHREGRIL